MNYFMETLEEHQKITCHILELLEKHKLYLHSDKCEFCKGYCGRAGRGTSRRSEGV